MRTILVSGTLFVTVLSSVSFGVISAYASVHVILYGFARQSKPQEEPVTALVVPEVAAHQS